MIEFENRENAFVVFRLNRKGFPAHVHSDLELTVCIEEGLQASCDFQTRTLRPGDAMLAFPYDVHAYQPTACGAGISMIVNPDVVPRFLSRLNSGRYENFVLNQDPALISVAKALYAEAKGQHCTDVMVGYLYILLGLVFRELPRRAAADPITSRDSFAQILAYLSEHFTEPISLTELAEKFGVNHSHLSRTFSAKLSCGYLDYLHQLRVERAKNLLAQTQDKVSDIAFQCGFSDQRSFNRVFRQLTQLTPREYREHRIKAGP